MKWIIDRIEDNTAVVEISDGKVIKIPLVALPAGVSESDVITIDIDFKETEKRKDKINRLADSLFVD